MMTSRITPREKEVLNLIAYEHSSKAIAERLHVSPQTVMSHRKNMMEKLGVRNTAGLVRVAFERGLMRVGQLACLVLCLLATDLSAQTPVASYNFFRDTVDISDNGNNLTNTGGLKTVYDDCRRYVEFDGNGYMINEDPALSLTAEMSLTFWMRTADIASDQKIIGQAVLGGTPRGFVIGPENNVLKAEVFTGDYGTTMVLRSDTIQANAWIHVAMVFDDTNDEFKIYLDGLLDTSYIGTYDDWEVPQSGDDLVVGIAPWDKTSFAYEGDLDDVKIYNSSLSAQQVEDIYNNAGLCPTSGDPIYVDSSATGNNTGLTWANAFTDLQEAIDLSCNCPGADIWVADGTYHPTQDNPRSSDNSASDVTFYIDHPAKIYGGFNGSETMLSQRDWEEHLTILDGAIPNTTDTTLHVVVMDDDEVRPDWTLDGLQIRNGYSTGTFGLNSSGGGLKIVASTQASPTINNCTFYNNKAAVNGGAIDVNINGNNSNIGMTISACTFYDNQAGYNNAGRGGAIFSSANDTGLNELQVRNSLFYKNRATGSNGEGGAIFASASGVSGSGTVALQMINCTLADNEAEGDGGGIHISTDNIDEFKIYNSIFWNNVGDDGDDIFTNGSQGSIDSCLLGTGPGVLAANNLQVANYITQDPLFVSSGSDYSLMQGSPAINGGKNSHVPVGIDTDITGGQRMLNGQVDIGAYEVAACGMDILYVDIDADPGGDGLSWGSAFDNLQDAIDISASCDGVQSIWVAEGTYIPTRMYDSDQSGTLDSREETFYINHDVKIYGGFNGTELTADQRDRFLNPTILSGNVDPFGSQPGLYHIMYIDGREGVGGISFDTELQDLIFSDGDNPRTSGEGVGGAALYINANGGVATPQIRACVFRKNIADRGGAIYNNGYQGEASPSILASTFFDNMASRGAAIYNNGSAGISSPTIVNSYITSNRAINFGGGIYEASNSNGLNKSKIINCTFRNNNLGNAPNFIKEEQQQHDKNNSNEHGTGYYSDAGDNGGNESQITNCIFWDVEIAEEIFVQSGDGPTVDHCIVRGGHTDGTNIINQDPLFESNLLLNPNLQSNSPAINAGVYDSLPAGILTDINGNPRIRYGRVDMGVYEGVPCLNIDTIYVDISNTSPTVLADGSSWDAALHDLQEAINISNVCGGNKEIWVAQGVYHPTQDNPDSEDNTSRDVTFYIDHPVKIYGGFPSGGGSADDRDWTNNLTILTGAIPMTNDTAYHVIYIRSEVDDLDQLEVNGFEIKDGRADGARGHADGGGINAIRTSGDLKIQIKNCSFSNNVAQNSGGAICASSYSTASAAAFINSTNEVIIDNCQFSNNSADKGGAIYASGIPSPGDRAQSSISANKPTISNSRFTHNSANQGGAMYTRALAWTRAENTPMIINSVFSNNSADIGGGMYAEVETTVQNFLRDKDEIQKSLNDQYAINAPEIINSTFVNNNSEQGGGLYVSSKTVQSPIPTVALDVSNSLFWHNLATSDGQDIYMDKSSNDASISHSIVTDGGIYIEDQSDIDTMNVLKHDDPIFVDSMNNDFRLMSGSPAIDAGDSSLVQSVYDITGSAARISGQVDMGAYERFSCDKDLRFYLPGVFEEDNRQFYTGGAIEISSGLKGQSELLFSMNEGMEMLQEFEVEAGSQLEVILDGCDIEP